VAHYVYNNPVNFVDPTGHYGRVTTRDGGGDSYTCVTACDSVLSQQTVDTVKAAVDTAKKWCEENDCDTALSFLSLYLGTPEASAAFGLKAGAGSKASEAEAATSTVQLGKQGESWLMETIGAGGETQAAFKTSLGWRYVDYLKEGVAYESKNEFLKMSSSFTKQALKDSELLSGGQADRVVWYLWKGADKGALDFLAEHGIEWVIH
jgi:hypothetical protein